MIIPKEILNKWKLLRSHGDNKKIAGKNEGIIEMDVTRAFSSGKCSDDVFEAMAAFYKVKEERVNQFI